MSRRHAHALILGRGWSRSIRGAGWSRVVLRATPGETNARVANGVALHLIDRHFSSVALYKLDKSASLSGRNLDIGDFSEALKERSQLILSNISRKAANKDGGVVGVCELVHWLRSAVVAHWRGTHRVHAGGHAAWHPTTLHSWHTGGTAPSRLVLCGSCRDTHGSIAAVYTLHLCQCTLLVTFIAEAHEAISARHARDRIGHDLCRFARWESSLEERYQDVLVDLWAKITYEDRELGSSLITSISKATTRGPIQLEWSASIRNH